MTEAASLIRLYRQERRALEISGFRREDLGTVVRYTPTSPNAEGLVCFTHVSETGLHEEIERHISHFRAANAAFDFESWTMENAYLAFDPGEEAPINALLGASITYRIATGPREGQKVFTLQTLPAEPEVPRREVAESSGFSLHAGIAAKASQRDKLERLARYVARPPVANERLSLTEGGNVRCALKTPYRDGTTHVIFEPEDFIARLAALVPKPRAHQIRYHGVFAPASPDRARVVPRTRAAVAGECGEASVTDRQRALALTWAQRLKRVFAIEIETCRRCGGRLRVIASIEAPTTIERILAHLSRDAEPVDPAYPGRAPPQGELSF